IKKIGPFQFYGFNNLKSIQLPATITSVGRAAFLDCINLETACFDGTSTQLENIKIEKDNDCLLNVIVLKSRKIVFFHSMGSQLQDVLNIAIEEFENKFPGWTIESVQVGSYDDVKNAVIDNLQHNTQPNIAYCYSDHIPNYIATGKVIDLAKYIHSQDLIEVMMKDRTFQLERVGFTSEEIADFITGYYNEGKSTNYGNYSDYGYTSSAMFSLPFSKATEVLYYNESALIDAGITKEVDGKLVAKIPETWEELWEACSILKAKYPNSTPLGYDSEGNWFITMCEQNNWEYTSTQGEHYKFNNPNTIQWLKNLKEKYELGYFCTQRTLNSYVSSLFTNGAENGCTFAISSSASARYLFSFNNSFEVGVAPIPGSQRSDGVVYKSAIAQGPSLCMLTQGDDEKDLMAWEFIKLLFEPDFQAEFSIVSGYGPTRKSAYQTEIYKEFLKTDSLLALTANVTKSMIENYFTSPAFVGSALAREQVGNAIYYTCIGKKTVQEILEEAEKNCKK
ncbi:MAG: extracellular solute-binding protein, partial [Anaeroplasmataceae bacterium]|nr:extracellular solute-binding protein [Anaeroplasmataceae bacterium]